MQKRSRHVVIKATDEELAKLHALAEANDEPIARWIRRTVAIAYRERFGSEAPPEPKTKHPRT